MANLFWIKHLHIALAVVSVGLFALRFCARQVDATFVHRLRVKVAPHLIDTLLLASGVALAVLYRLSPLETHWLLVKLLLLVGYIGAGMGAMKAADGGRRFFYGLLALCFVAGVVFMAVLKPF
ncbi:SirB2 family protein [Microbulbifer halophilus]|uniref:SirB2 family protein n=1 Tax=Microbulbifer halophilus TaxID=453963 RepID=A0ABW5E6H7_9GAMM|nr:SirB2 family protein [Microbulbifer halophilus]MCW8125554.1 SirB2 family protein [Microbulbifer halophilus]